MYSKMFENNHHKVDLSALNLEARFISAKYTA